MVCLPVTCSLFLTVLEENVEQDDADLVICADVGVQQDGNNGPHGVFDLLSLGICAHSQILEQRTRRSRLNTHFKCLQKCLICNYGRIMKSVCN